PGALLAPMADAADVGAVSQPDHGHPVGAGPLDGRLGGLEAHDLAEPAVAVEHRRRTVVHHPRVVRVDLQPLAHGTVHVGRDHADPVGVVTGQVGAHELVGHQGGLSVAAAHAAAHPADEDVQTVWVDKAHEALPGATGRAVAAVRRAVAAGGYRLGPGG